LLVLGCALAAAAPPPPKTYQLPPETYEKAVQFQRRLYALHFSGVAWDLSVLVGMVALGVGPRIRDAVERRTRSSFVRRSTVAAAVLAIPWLADIPLAMYRHSLAVSFGLSVQPWAPWFLDVLKAGVATGIPALLCLVGALAVARRAPRRWWIYAWLVGVLLMIAAAYAAPVIFDPLFYRFTPLERTNPDLVRALQEVAARAGYPIPASRIFEMDASRNTRAVNAYMTGFGHSRRIVIWDTTLKALDTAQIQTVFAHELGHYALHHIPRGIAVGSLGLLFALWLLNLVLSRMRSKQVRGIDDPAILPFAMAVVLVIAFLSEPIANGYSRWQEHQADIYELELMHGLVPDAGRNSAEVDQIMAQIDLADPEPSSFIRFWLYDHPTTNERMLFAQQYDPWGRGEQPEFIGK
jgi:STE24 endopeptidase